MIKASCSCILADICLFLHIRNRIIFGKTVYNRNDSVFIHIREIDLIQHFTFIQLVKFPYISALFIIGGTISYYYQNIHHSFSDLINL